MPDLVEPTPAGERDPELVTRVADTFVDLMRTFTKARQAMMQAAQHDVEWTSHVILRSLKNQGPMRASALADHLQADPSTISRQVAALVKDGHIVRQADPEDGRASLLVVTEKADAVLADYDQLRTGYFARMLDGWSDADLRQFSTLLERFGKTYRSTNQEWIAAKIAASASRTRSTH